MSEKALLERGPPSPKLRLKLSCWKLLPVPVTSIEAWPGPAPSEPAVICSQRPVSWPPGVTATRPAEAAARSPAWMSTTRPLVCPHGPLLNTATFVSTNWPGLTKKPCVTCEFDPLHHDDQSRPSHGGRTDRTWSMKP